MRKCPDCGRFFEGPAQRRRCPRCAKARAAAQSADSNRAIRRAGRKARAPHPTHCACGTKLKLHRGPGRQPSQCPACADQKMRAYQAAYYKRTKKVVDTRIPRV